MPSLKLCKERCERFLRSSLPVVTRVESGLPSLPKFHAVADRRRGKTKFVEKTQPNWWQLPKDVKQALLQSFEGRVLASSLANTEPFSKVIGKWISIGGERSSKYSSEGIASEMLVSYLFAAGPRRWKPSLFEKIWGDCLSYFDPAEKKLEHCVYAPIAMMSGVPRRLTLGDGLEIRRLQAADLARLASLDPSLAGVSMFHRFTTWPVHFFVARYDLDKRVTRDPAHEMIGGPLGDWESRLNREVALLRSLLGPELAVPTYAVIRDGYPRDPGGGDMRQLVWHPRFFLRTKPRSRSEVTAYAERRRKFLDMQGSRGWDWVGGSMRRFAAAWEAPFPADSLRDVVAALEGLLVRETDKVSAKLCIRTTNLIGRSPSERKQMSTDLKDAYDYRSRVAHGDFLFDNVREWETAKLMKRAKGKKGKPFYHVNEIHRLTYAVSHYYQRALGVLIDRKELKIDWAAQGL